jgi:hypothetical protein
MKNKINTRKMIGGLKKIRSENSDTERSAVFPAIA